MLLGVFSSLPLKSKQQQFVSVDIGTSSIKVMALDLSGIRPKLSGIGVGPTPAGAISNNAVVKPDQIGLAIRKLLDANGIKCTKAVLAIPGTCAFTKKITMPHSSLKELKTTIQFEAGNYIPHSIDAVHLDFQVLKSNGKSTMEVLLVAVKNEIVQTYLSAIEQAELEPSIADVDYFALENMFELSYPEEKKKTVALINVGARYSSVNIVKDGESLFAGDVGVGGRLYTDALCESLGMKPADAEKAKSGAAVEGFDEHLIQETRDRTTEHIVGEIYRQLGFFRNAATVEQNIEAIYLCGGSSQMPGLLEELNAKTGMNCHLVHAFRGLDCSEQFDKDLIKEVEPSMAVSVGLAVRRLGDKKHAIA